MTWNPLPTPAPVGGESAAREEAKTASFTSSTDTQSSETFIHVYSTAVLVINSIAFHLMKHTSCVGHHHHFAGMEVRKQCFMNSLHRYTCT